jgi:uncharacterized protein (DUF58 family)
MPRFAVASHLTEISVTLKSTANAPRYGLLGYDLHTALTPGQDFSPVAFLSAEKDKEATASYFVTPPRSGHFDVGPFYLSGGDPFGFYKNWRMAAPTSELIVLPNPVSFRMPRQDSASLIAMDELATVAVPGESTEFMGVREYRSGEPLKRVHWPTTARLGRLISRQYEMNVSASISTLLVMEPTMLKGSVADTPREYALRMIAGLARGTISDNYQFSFLKISGKNSESLAGTGYNFYQMLSLHLAGMSGAAEPEWESARRSILHYLPRRSFLLVFLSTLNADTRRALKQLAMHYSSVAVVQFDRQSFESGKRLRETAGLQSRQDGYTLRQAGVGEDLGRLLGELFARSLPAGGAR